MNDFEKIALKRLSLDDKIEIKKADKGVSIVIMDKENYKEKINAHLTNEKSYRLIENENPLKDLQTNINSFLETIYVHQHISENTLKFLSPQMKPRTSLFYILPKIHKPKIPGRPIVSSINSVTENISEFLTKCIQPLTLNLSSHIKDTKDFLKKY